MTCKKLAKNELRVEETGLLVSNPVASYKHSETRIVKDNMGPPDNKELELINKLRENVRDLDLCEEVLGNENLIRWIRARDLNLKDAEEMFRNYIKWFDEIKLDSIFVHEVPKEVSEVIIQRICGLDHWSNPIITFSFGQMDAAKLMREGYKNEMMVHSLQLFERDAYFVRRLMAERQKTDNIILYSGILDMEGLSWRQLVSTDVIQHVLALAKIFEANYPETVHKVIVINAPRVFAFFYRLVYPFLSQRTIDKIQIYGNDRQQWQEAIYKLAPKESLPKMYGGILPDDIDILPKLHDCIPKKRGSY